MKTIHRRIIFFVAIVGVVVLVRWLSSSQFVDLMGLHKTTPQKMIIDQAAGDWPMFRGGQGLLGRASGSLPDKLDLIWRFKTNGPVKSSPAIVGGRVFVGSSDANVYSIDIKDGRKIWSYKTDAAVEASPCVIAGDVYVGSQGGFLYALDANTSSLKWKYKTGGEIPGAANWTTSPDGRLLRIIVGSYDDKLHCVDATTGREVWTYASENYINGSPAIDVNKAVFGGCDAMIHIVGLDDGKMLGKIDGGSYIAASAAIDNGQVYCGNYGNIFFRADIGQGKVVWEFKQSEQPYFASPAIGEKVVVVGSRDEHIYCLDRNNGGFIWKFRTLGAVDSSAVICGDKVIACSTDGRIYMLSLADGSMLWSYQIGQAIISSPAIAQSVVVVGCDDGYVYAFAEAHKI